MAKKKTKKSQKEVSNKIEFLDASVENEYYIKSAIAVLDRTDGDTPLERDQANSLSFLLERFLNRKILLEHVFAGRTLHNCTLSDIDKHGEISIVKRKLNAIWNTQQGISVRNGLV